MFIKYLIYKLTSTTNYIHTNIKDKLNIILYGCVFLLFAATKMFCLCSNVIKCLSFSLVAHGFLGFALGTTLMVADTDLAPCRF